MRETKTKEAEMRVFFGIIAIIMIAGTTVDYRNGWGPFASEEDVKKRCLNCKDLGENYILLYYPRDNRKIMEHAKPACQKRYNTKKYKVIGLGNNKFGNYSILIKCVK